MATMKQLWEVYDNVHKPPSSTGILPEEQYKSTSFPCNPIPFANRIATLIKERGTDAIQEDKDVKACLWILMGQAYGQLATIDLGKEYMELWKDDEE